MIRKIAPAVFVLGAVLAALPAQAKSRIALTSIIVDLPQGQRDLPNGPGADAARGICLACHSAGMILNQPTMAKAGWEAEVAKMRNVYKAPVDEKDVPTIVDYLTAIKGPK
jgi:hypothetical protein